MKVFFGALVLNFMPFFNEIGASGLRKISTKPSRKDREGIDHLITSRRPTQSASAYNHIPLANQALDSGGYQSYDPQSFDPQSHGYYPHLQESFHQLHSAEASDLRRFSTIPHQNDREGIDHLVTSRLPTQSSSTYDPTLLAYQALNLDGHQSYSPQSFHQQFHGYAPHPQEFFHPLNPAEISHLVNEHNFKNGRLPTSDDDTPPWLIKNNQIHHQKPEHSQENSEQENIDWLLGQYHDLESQLAHEHLKYEEMRLNTLRKLERQRIKQEKKQEVNLRKEKAVRIRYQNPSQNTEEASTMNPPATRETGRRDKGKAASRKDVSSSRVKGKAAKHDFDDFEPTLIESRMSNYNPYIEFPQNDPNQWGHPGGLGTGSHQ